MDTQWKSFNLPQKFLGDEHVSDNDFVTTYKTEILLPKNSEYSGYCFLHPSKLINYGNEEFVEVVYNDEFTFLLVKKDREPGKRYKRHKLSVTEILKIYEPEEIQLNKKIARQEANRKARIGLVELLDCREVGFFNLHVVFRYKKTDYNSSGSAVKHSDIHSRYTIAKNIPCGVFERAYDALRSLLQEYKIISKIRYQLVYFGEQSSISNSFDTLCDQWVSDFINKADAILAGELLLEPINKDVSEDRGIKIEN